MTKITLTTCPSNLKEAIDWILRVTGKDGQRGPDNTAALAKAVKQLLQCALDEVDRFFTDKRVNGAELQRLKQGLQKAVQWVDEKPNGLATDGPISRLGSALSMFIGYQNSAFESYRSPQITGAGIAPSNIATHRLCDAAIAFTIGVLESLKGHSAVNVTVNRKKVEKVITKLHHQYGKGTTGWRGVATEVESQLGGNFGVNVDGFLSDFRTAFEKLNSLPTDTAENVAEKVGEYVKGVFNGSKGSKTWGDSRDIEGKLKELMKDFNGGGKPYDASSLNQKINQVSQQLQPTTRNNVVSITNALSSGKGAFIWQLQKGNYTPTNYETNVQSASIKEVHAKIFLSCLPLILNNLSYFYWQCRDGGAWQNQNLTGGPLSPFMEGHWFRNSYMNENMTGTSVVNNVMKASFNDFSTASAQQKSYSDFLKEFKSTGEKTWQSASTASTDNYLSGLYILCSCYFKCQQLKRAEKATRSPQTIREMLYFLAALQFSLQYDAFDRYVTKYFKVLVPNPTKGTPDARKDHELALPVADSSKSGSRNGDTLSASDLKQFLTASCYISSGVLGIMQGPASPQKSNEPWLHKLFCNTEFNFNYLSGHSLFNILAKYAYALQFQLSFLYQQCSGTYSKACGWNECTYGSTVKFDGVMSHICTGFKCGEQASICNHVGSGSSGSAIDNCKHNDRNEGCGTSGKPSPLQGFLTDNLMGFCRQHPGTSTHLDACSGLFCHVPMGFEANDLGKGGTGAFISIMLKPLCGSYTSPLPKLSEKLACLTKRTPQTLGDVFGFLWHLNSQLFKNTRPTLKNLIDKFDKAFGLQDISKNFISDPYGVITKIWNHIERGNRGSSSPSPTGLSRSLEAMAPVIPFLYQLFMAKDPNTLPGALFDLNKHCHKYVSGGQLKHQSHSSGTSCSNPNDLWSLYQSLKLKPTSGNDTQANCRSGNCGGYLYPLTYTFGSTFAPKHASSYLSWFLHLTDDLEAGLREILERFKGLSCTGCDKCSSGTHGSDSCKCPSLVDCADVLPLLYDYGFSFNNAYLLRGWTNTGGKLQADPQNNRTCGKFSNQLSAVLAPSSQTPLLRLLHSIDDFLYLFRFYFCYNLSAIWTLYLCIILYTLFFILDTLHLRSHLRFSSSHILPPIGLLTAGKSPALTKLTYYMP